jgi:NADH:ubiquinone oxidoreductase subunit 6 (subunit J)
MNYLVHYRFLKFTIFWEDSILSGTGSFFYFLFIIFILISVVMIFLTDSPVISVLHLIVTFLNVSFLMLLLQVEYLGLVFIIVYVGAISMLFLFIVMMLDIRRDNLVTIEYKFNFFYVIFGFILFIIAGAELYLLIFDSFNFLIINFMDFANNGAHVVKESALLPEQREYDLLKYAYEEGDSFFSTLFSVTKTPRPDAEVPLNYFLMDERLDRNSNFYFELQSRKQVLYRAGLDNIGHFLYTHNFIYFIIVGLVLIIPMIGAIVLAAGKNKI